MEYGIAGMPTMHNKELLPVSVLQYEQKVVLEHPSAATLRESIRASEERLIIVRSKANPSHTVNSFKEDEEQEERILANLMRRLLDRISLDLKRGDRR